MNEREEEAIREVRAEFKKADEHAPHANPHETYGILAEELAEFFDEVRKKEEMRSPIAMRKELAQVAAAAIRGMLALDTTAPVELISNQLKRAISNPVTPGSPLDEAINGRRQHFVEVQLTEPVERVAMPVHVVDMSEANARQPTTTRVVVDINEAVRLEMVERIGDREQVRTFDAFMYSCQQTRDRVDVSYQLQPKPTFREVRTERGDIFRVGVAQPAPLSMDGEDMMPTEGDPL